MPKKNFLAPVRLISAGSMSANVTSGALDISYLDNVGVQLIFTGTPTGSFFVDVSLDGGTTWSALSISPTPGASGAGGDLFIDLSPLSAPKMRLRYVRTSGTGTLNAYVSGKEA